MGNRPIGTLARLLCRPIIGRPTYVWLLWAAAAGALALCPMMLSDPGMWPYLIDPELLALIVIMGAQVARLEVGVLRVRLADLAQRSQAWLVLRVARF